jgi:hypothetical protein
MFTMRLSKDESDRLDQLAAHYGLNGVGVIRMLLKREADLVRARVARLQDEQPIDEYDPDLYDRVVKAAHARYKREGWIWNEPNNNQSTIDRTGLMILRSGELELGRYRLHGETLKRVSKSKS